MAKVTITIDTDNAAFEETGELSRIVAYAATSLSMDTTTTIATAARLGIVVPLRDINGNKVGEITVSP